MKNIVENTHLGKRLQDILTLDMMGVSETHLDREINHVQMRALPFISSSIALLFVLYAVAQLVVLREANFVLLSVVGLVSGLIAFGLRQLALHRSLPEKWANELYGFMLAMILLSLLLRLGITKDPKQTANFILFWVALGVLFISGRWFIGLLSLTAVSWIISALLIPQLQVDLRFYTIAMGAAMITAVILHLFRSHTHRRNIVLRIREETQRKELAVIAADNARLYDQAKQFNQQLETKVKERTKELLTAYAKLERLNKTKTDFITIASHELRTPMTLINFYAQMFIDDDEIQENQQHNKWANGIYEGSARMEEVVERMLDVAKIDSMSLDLYPAPINLSFFLRSMRSQFKSALAERKLTFEIADLSNLPQIEADSEALEKVFYHLFVNAIKYTPDGGQIMVNGRLHHSFDSMDCVEITLQDSGIGIDPAIHILIFEKFYQTGEVMLHSSGKTSFKGGGAGLGLAIAQGIVEAHHGKIWVESDGHDEENFPGATFHILLPINHATLSS